MFWQTTTSIPWLPFIVVSAVLVRLLMLPLMVKQMVLINKMAKISPNIRLLFFCTKQADLSFPTKVYYFSRAAWRYSRQVKVNPLLFIAYNLVQIPVFILMVMAIRKISFDQDLTGCGIFWFKVVK